MSSQGIERIETAEGDDFDPNTQEAMTTMAAVEGKRPNTVANVWQVSRLMC
jgi:molecular chaperone GrpE (heat shock protein)